MTTYYQLSSGQCLQWTHKSLPGGMYGKHTTGTCDSVGYCWET